MEEEKFPILSESEKTSELFLNVLLEKFEPLLEADVPSTTQRWGANINSFFCGAEKKLDATTPLLSKKPKTQKRSYLLYNIAQLTVACAAIYASSMYYDSSEAWADQVREDWNGLINYWQNHTPLSIEWLSYGVEIIAGMIQYFAVPTFALFGIEINKQLTKVSHYMLTRSAPESELTGKVNPVFLISSVMVGVFSELPLIKVAWDSAKIMPKKINSLVAGVCDMSNYSYGGSEFFSGINEYTHLGMFAATWDNTRSQYPRHEIKQVRAKANQLVASMYAEINEVFSEHGKKLKDCAADTQNSLTHTATKSEQIFQCLETLANSKSKADLKTFLQKIIPDLEFEANLCVQAAAQKNYDKTICFGQQVVELLEAGKRSKAACTIGGEALKLTGKTILYLELAVVTLAMLVNDIAAAYYAGYDILQDSLGRKIIGIMAGICTGMASLGLASFGIIEVKDFFLGESGDPMRAVHPGKLIVLSCIVAFMGFFSGGSTAVEGAKYVTRMLMDLGYTSLAVWVPTACANLGFLGAGITDMPYCLALVSSFLTACSEQLGDKTTKQLVAYMDGCHNLAFCIEHMKVGHFINLEDAGIFSDKTLAEDIQYEASSYHHI